MVFGFRVSYQAHVVKHFSTASLGDPMWWQGFHEKFLCVQLDVHQDSQHVVLCVCSLAFCVCLCVSLGREGR
jgi:hypothetical protein